MAYRYACERSAQVAAIAVVSGALAIGCTPDHPTSVLAFHGTWDPSVPYHGGGNMDAGVDFPFFPVQLTVEYWRWLNGLPRCHGRCPAARTAASPRAPVRWSSPSARRSGAATNGRPTPPI